MLVAAGSVSIVNLFIEYAVGTMIEFERHASVSKAALRTTSKSAAAQVLNTAVRKSRVNRAVFLVDTAGPSYAQVVVVLVNAQLSLPASLQWASTILSGRYDDFSVAWYAAVSGALPPRGALRCARKSAGCGGAVTPGTVVITMIVNTLVPHLPLLLDYWILKPWQQRKARASESVKVCF